MAAPASAQLLCQDNSDGTYRVDPLVHAQDTGKVERAFGYYAVPSGPPRGIVVFDHGHGNSAWKWQLNLATQARRLGMIAVAMDYRRQIFPGGDITKTSFGWRVREGAEDSIAAAQLFEGHCLVPMYGRRHHLPIVIYGVSMGGNTSGLAAASRAKRLDGTPLFDYWFDLEGVTNVIETYLEARAVAGPPLNNSTGKTAVAEINDEMGGPIESKGPVYGQHTVVNRADDIKASGIKGVVIVHGFDDGTVGSNESAEMYSRLQQEDIPTDYFTVTRHGQAPSGNTLEDTLTITPHVPGYTSPFTGHGGENDPSHPVIRTGFDRLAALLLQGAAPNGFHQYVVDEG